MSKLDELGKRYVNVFVKGQLLVSLDNTRRNENFCNNNIETVKGNKKNHPNNKGNS